MTIETATAVFAGFDPDGATVMQVARLEPVMARAGEAVVRAVAPFHAAADVAGDAAAALTIYVDEDARTVAITLARNLALGPAPALESAYNDASTRLGGQRRNHNNLHRYITDNEFAERVKDDGSEHGSMAALSAALEALA